MSTSLQKTLQALSQEFNDIQDSAPAPYQRSVSFDEQRMPFTPADDADDESARVNENGEVALETIKENLSTIMQSLSQYPISTGLVCFLLGMITVQGLKK
ncbi:hypothetical protein ACVBOS_001039 [Vibrio vulnificus]